ncbi:MAG: hypothetical protein UV45_C0003G0003 [Candidatus Azambacteria bacterium GW2011_GWB1_42_72]|nr:MAG: hypothetical protein UV45_C0003G0003 [Candidatus Azambacteria bacterium GW2011_GWB1_42_72]
MAMLKVDPGPKIGFILNILLDEILDDPEKNGKKYLSEQAKKLNGESLAKLEKMFKMAQDKTREAAEEEFKGIKSKFRV